MYQVLHALATRFPETRGTFLHVPFATEQVAEKNAAAEKDHAAGEKDAAGEKGSAVEKFRPLPSMPLEMMTRGLQVALEAALATDVDLADSESGTTC